MRKKFYDNPENVYGTMARLNEVEWFKKYQDMLLWMANTVEGKALLCIDDHGYPIVEISKKHVKYYLGQTPDGRPKFRSDFRVGAKWANVIRYRFKEFTQMALAYHATRQMYDGFSRIFLDMSRVRMTTLTAYPDPDPETTTCDGWCRHLEVGSWATVHDGAGNSSADDETGDWISAIVNNGSSWWYIIKFHTGFDTSSIGSDTIDDATQSYYITSKSDNGSNSPTFNIYSSSPASNTAVAGGDYDAFGSTGYSSAVAYGSVGTSAYHDYVYNATGEAAINGSGVTNTGHREVTYDVGDSEPGTKELIGRLNASYADNTGTSQDPKLVVNHTASSTFVPRLVSIT